MIRIGFAGLTHLGQCSAAAAAARGFEVTAFDRDAGIVASLKRGATALYEPGLSEAMRDHAKRLNYTDRAADLAACDIIYIATDVPTDESGGSDLSGVHALIEAVAAVLKRDGLLVVLCQVPPGFTRALPLDRARLFYQVETLVFGRAVERAINPERFILGCADPARALPKPLAEFLAAFQCPILPMRYESAELAKIAINCCLVASVTIANTLAGLSEQIGADWSEIVPALKLDRRIGAHAYLAPGLGLSGGNLERDLATVLDLSLRAGAEASLVSAMLTNSRYRRDWPLRILHRELLHRTGDPQIAILGLAYKENTHSTKNAPSLPLIDNLKPWRLRVYDPKVSAAILNHPKLLAAGSAIEAAAGADALVVMTPWPEFGALALPDLAAAMAGRLIIDPFGIFDAKACAKAGFRHFTLGRA